MARFLGRLCREHRIQVVHLQFSFALPVALAWSDFDRRIPVVYHWHNPPTALPKNAVRFVGPSRG